MAGGESAFIPTGNYDIINHEPLDDYPANRIWEGPGKNGEWINLADVLGGYCNDSASDQARY